MIRLTKTYKFAVITALYISFICTLLGIIFFKLLPVTWYGYVGFFASIFLASTFIIQYRVERFIYQRVKKIYDDVSLLDSTSFSNVSVTTDMDTLTREVKKFATNKKLEIEMLKVREEYRREFLGNVSHELKTPLFTVQGYLSTVLEGGIKDKTIRQNYLARAEKGVERLIRIVEDLDMITKLEVGNLQLNTTKFDIVPLIQEVFDLLEMKASKKDIILMFDMKYSKPYYVNADKEKIEQVLINLIVNSIKYGKEKGTTEVSIEQLTKNLLLVRVKDDGEGIAPQHLPRLFERFFRVDKSGSRDAGGSGLGLSIVKHIIEAHEQKIYVESEPGQGAEFSFTIKKAQ
ncbi:MAG: sensor histidine kinase [Flavobacterium sp.]|nr:sensor histidine kinase [Flavobacterium sp.]